MLDKIKSLMGLRKSNITPAAAEVCRTVHHAFVDMADRQNASNDSDSLRFAVTDPTSESTADGDSLRFSICNAYWAISVRSNADRLDFFVLPSVQLPLRGEAETPSRLKLRLRIDHSDGRSKCLMDDVLVTDAELQTLLAALFRDVLVRSKSDFDFMPESVRVQYGDQSLTAAVRELLKEKGSLTARIAEQQESLQSFIAGEIHDNVISDLLFMLRKIENDSPLEKADSIKLLERTVDKLRDLCAELVPRNLGDWGLEVLLNDHLNKVCQRSQIQGAFICECELPPIDSTVELQIFRVVQECLNNVEKHAQAKNVRLEIRLVDNELEVVVADDGLGFDHSAGRTKGTGLSIIMERVHLLKLQMPASLQMSSAPGKGTQVILKVMLSPQLDERCS